MQMFKRLKNGGFFACGLAIILFIASVCLSSQISQTSAKGEIFSDVDLSSDYAEAIEYVRDEGIVEGYGDGSFGPGRTINRAEFVKILVGAVAPFDSAQGTTTFKNCFPDVKEEWFAGYVCYAKEKGMIGGYPDGTFRPGDSVNFAEAAKIIVEAFGEEVVRESEGEVWFKAYVEVLASKNAIPMTVMGFEAELERRQMAEMIWRLMTGNVSEQSKNYNQLNGTEVVITDPIELDTSGIEPKEVTKDHGEVLVVFLYLAEPLPEDIQQEYIGTGDDPTDLLYFETWIEEQAKKYDQDFKRELVIYPEQIKVPERYIDYEKEQQGAVKDDQDFEIWIKREYPDMEKYETTGFVVYDSEDDVAGNERAYGGDNTLYQYIRGRDYIDGEGKNARIYSPYLLNDGGFVETFAHEFMHTLGAKDKYELATIKYGRVCDLDEQGNVYDSEDVMCGQYAVETYATEDGKSVFFREDGTSYYYDENNVEINADNLVHVEEIARNPIDDLTIEKVTEPTAMEIGWLYGNEVVDRCVTQFPEIIGVRSLGDLGAEDNTLSIQVRGCKEHFERDSYIVGFYSLDNIKMGWLGFEAKSFSSKRSGMGIMHLNYGYDKYFETNNKLRMKICGELKYVETKFDYQDSDEYQENYCGRAVEVDFSDFSIKELKEEGED